MQVTKIHPKSKKGVVLANGKILLSRQGNSSAVNGSFGSLFISCNVLKGSVVGKVSFTPILPNGNQGETIFRSSTYSSEELGEFNMIYPEVLQKDIFNFVELHTGTRPSGIIHAVHGYCYGDMNNEDLFLSPFRFDSEQDAVVGTSSAVPVAVYRGHNDKFDPENVIMTDECSEIQSCALQNAIRIGFHSFDIKRGRDYCMRRLTWLAGQFLIEDSNEILDTFILANDMESDAKFAFMIQ